MIARSESLRPTSRDGPAFLMSEIVQPDVGLVFSKDMVIVRSSERLRLHLSIAHPRGFAVDHDWILPQFIAELGGPDEQGEARLAWRYGPIVRGIVHHFFCKP